MQNSQKLDRYIWYSYDFANSVALVSLIYYFSLWTVVDNGLSQWIVSLPISLSTLVLIIFLPRIAKKVDHSGAHKLATLVFSFGAVLALCILSFLKPNDYFASSIFLTYFAFFVCYQSGYVFYTSFLKELGNDQERIQISGYGQLWGQLGNLVGVLLSFATINLVIFNVSGKQQVFLSASLVFFLLLVPFLWFRRNRKSTIEVNKDVEIKLSTLKKLYSNKPVFWFLLTYFFYADAMLTISYFITLYLTKGALLEPNFIKISSFCLLAGTIVGGPLTGVLRKYDSLKTIKILLYCWSITITTLALAYQHTYIYIVLIVLGILLSLIFATSRSFYSNLIPLNERAEYFSLFVIFERMGAVIGPLIWSAVVSATTSMGESSAYRMAMVSTAILTSCSILVLRKVTPSYPIKN